jgi:hypothetical protein
MTRGKSQPGNGAGKRIPSISPPSVEPRIPTPYSQMLLSRRVAQWSKPPSKAQNAKMRIAAADGIVAVDT